MLNGFAKFLLAATALSPILGAVAINQISLQKPWTAWAPWLATAVILALLCWLILRYTAENVERTNLEISEFENNDKEVLAFLLAYLLPFLSSENMSFEGQWLTGAYIIGIILIVITHAGAFHFNPVMGLLGYHFYGIKSTDGVSCLLITRQEMRRRGQRIDAVPLAHNIYLDRKQ